MQTAVEWLDEQIQERVIAQDVHARKMIIEISMEDYMRLKQQSKEMERQQHGKTWDGALDAGQSRAWNVMRAYSDFDDYYVETYGSKGSDAKDYTKAQKNEERFNNAEIIKDVASSQTEISDEEMIQAAIKHSEIYTLKFIPRSSFIDGAKWYREQLKKKQ